MPMPPHRYALVTLLALPGLATAQDRSALPLWELGLFGGAVSQQAYPGAEQQVNRALVLPWFIYRGEFLRADRDTLGLRAFKSQDLELDIGVAGAFGSRADDIDARRGMPDLGTLMEFGPRLTWKLGEAAGGRWRVQLPVRGVYDLTDGGAQLSLDALGSAQTAANSLRSLRRRGRHVQVGQWQSRLARTGRGAVRSAQVGRGHSGAVQVGQLPGVLLQGR